MKYRKKPIVIEAYKWDGDSEELFRWADNVSDGNGTSIHYYGSPSGEALYIKTLEGNMNVPIGNFVICGVRGEFYSCEPNIFNETHEVV